MILYFHEIPFLQAGLSLLVAICGVSYVLSKLAPGWKRYRESVSITKDIACDEPHWLFGHLLTIEPTEASFLKYLDLLKKFPKCQPMWLGPFTVYVQGYFPDFMKTILSTDEPKDDVGYRFLRPWVGDGLLTSSGAKWKRNRRLLTPAFHFEILKYYLKCMNAATTELVDKWCEKSGLSDDFVEVEMFHDIGQMTLDSVLRCILSKESGCQRDDNNSYLQAVKYLTETAMKRLFNPFYHSDAIFNMSPTGRKFKRALKTAHDYTESAIKERRAEMELIGRDYDEDQIDFLDTLLLAKDEQGIGLTHQEICDEVDTFVFEGHDTVSSAISWAMYSLAAYPDYQEKCREEVIDILEGRLTVEWEDLSKFRFLTMFIKESMRLYPPVFTVGRSLSKPLCFTRGFGKDLFDCSDQVHPDAALHSSKLFPKHTNFSMNMLLLHYNPHIWKKPMIFDPERFTPENVSKRSPHAYLPFSAGPRNCIGQHFAMNEIKVVLARTLSTFRLLLDEAHPKPEIEMHVILRAKNGIHLKLQRLRDSC